MKKQFNWTLALVLSVALASSLMLTGCGSLTRIIEEPEPPREDTAAVELTNVLRSEEDYKGIEVFHGTWEDPSYSPDEKGYFYEERGWIYLHIEGEPTERGYQHGWLLADYIQRNLDHNQTLFADLYALDWEYLRVNAERMWGEQVNEELKAELEGIVAGAVERGATFDYLDLLVLNGLEELRDCWFPTVQETYYQELALGLWSPNGTGTEGETADLAGESAEDTKEDAIVEATTLASPEDTTTTSNPSFVLNSSYARQASALVATGSATEDGSIILAQNTIVSYTDSNFSNVMIDVEPKEGQRFTMQAAPGFIHSSAEAYSTESLLIANTLIKGFNVYNEAATPEFLRIRSAVQYAQTLDEFTEGMAESINGGLASSWLVGELETNQIMELELGLSFYNVEKLDDGCFVSFSGVGDTRILNYETETGGYADIRQGADSRSVRLTELVELNQGTITTQSAQDIISDHLDPYLSKAIASSRSMCAHYDTDNAEHTADSSVVPNMPYGTVDAKVMSSELAKENTILARWGSACGRSFDSAGFISKNLQFSSLSDYLYDRPSQFWNKLYPLDSE